MKDIKSVIDAEIKYHKSEEAQKIELNKDYKKGFLAGLKQAKESLIISERAIKENQ